MTQRYFLVQVLVGRLTISRHTLRGSQHNAKTTLAGIVEKVLHESIAKKRAGRRLTPYPAVRRIDGYAVHEAFSCGGVSCPPMFGTSPYDFGYPWWMTWGHAIPLAVFGLLTLAAWRLAWRTWIVAVSATLALWGLAGFLIVNQVLNVSQPLRPPTSQFLPHGSGRVLDLGASWGAQR